MSHEGEATSVNVLNIIHKKVGAHLRFGLKLALDCDLDRKNEKLSSSKGNVAHCVSRGLGPSPEIQPAWMHWGMPRQYGRERK